MVVFAIGYEAGRREFSKPGVKKGCDTDDNLSSFVSRASNLMAGKHTVVLSISHEHYNAQGR